MLIYMPRQLMKYMIGGNYRGLKYQLKHFHVFILNQTIRREHQLFENCDHETMLENYTN